VKERDPYGDMVRRFVESFKWLVRAWNAGHLVDLVLPAEFICRDHYENKLWVSARGVFKYAEHMALRDNCFLPLVETLDDVGRILFSDRGHMNHRRALFFIISVSLFVRAFVDVPALLLWYERHGKHTVLTKAEEEIYDTWMQIRMEDYGLTSNVSSPTSNLSSFARVVYSQLRVIIAFAKVPFVPVLLQPDVTKSTVIQSILFIRSALDQLEKGKRLDEIGLGLPRETRFADAYDANVLSTHTRFV
jgi:hypothetical protein